MINRRLVLGCSLVSTLAGFALGLGVAEVSQNKFESQLYQNLHWKLAIAGAATGATIGAAQESIRQLHKQQVEEEAVRPIHR